MTSTAALDSIANDLARDEGLRVQMGTNNPSIWPGLNRAWDTLAARVAHDEGDALAQSLVTSFGRFTRNLVAAVPSNQQNAFTIEPSLRSILHAYGSWSATQDQKSYAVTRMLIQTLSNMVTSNDTLMTRLWVTYLNLPEEQVVFIRLLGSPDSRTVLSLLVLLVNCVHESNHRRGLLAETQVGARICIKLLDLMVILYDAEDSSDEGKAFDYGYHFFAHLFDGGFAPQLYANLSVTDEIIAPHQTTLLKLLDSYLHSSHLPTALVGMCPMLTACFFELCTFSAHAIRKSIGKGPVDNVVSFASDLSSQGAFDLMLPKACEALVLVTQCLVSATLELEGNIGKNSKGELSLLIRGAISPQGQDIAVCAIGKPISNFVRQQLLRLLDVFLPRINYGKPVTSAAAQSIPGTTDSTGFSYVKRDLVRLLGILCHKNKKIQDSIRICEGITVIMNMCVVDERNPYLREHAIFTLHNLLEDNEENQWVVNSIQPSERWDQDGMLQR
ncbi:spinocerebellar ataxia type 10 protein domain-containing protein [Boletus edulis BED1]|uniref:Ataxin-10 homolog n=1 Tax=Boletus edulis BED1 TaxID=1328754 RepID=A0AAD4C500_BOLED|nr:spinocerebellar ataxia type 10 protein domain-containing protein [Boletus edulis BED1]